MNDPKATPRPASSSPTGTLPAALRQWCDREYFFAKAQRRTNPYQTVPPGESAGDWTLYSGTWARPLILEVMRLGIWRPEDGE